MNTLHLWKNGNTELGINLYENSAKPYILMTTVWDGTQYQFHRVGQYKVLKTAQRAADLFVADSSRGKWEQVK